MQVCRNKIYGINRKGMALYMALLLVCGLLFSGHISVSAEENGPDIYGESYCVIDGNTGEVIISHAKDEKQYPASTTKVMTALLVLENVDDLKQKVTFTRSAINIDPTSSTLKPKAEAGEIMTVRDILYGMLLASGNECGAMLGEVVAGSEEAFTEMMNRKAEELGAVNTHFTNAYGIHDPDHYSTAYDLCLILKAAMENEGFRDIMDHKEYTIPKTNKNEKRELKNSHAFINGSIKEEGVIGGKTGSTPEAGRCLLTAAVQEGLYTISAVMKSDLDNVYADASVILEYARLERNGSLEGVFFEEKDDEVTAAERVRIRYSPTTKGGTAGVLEAGESIHRNGTYHGWSVVEYKNRTGYISSAYLLDGEGRTVESSESEPADSTAESSSEEPSTEKTASEESSSSETETAPSTAWPEESDSTKEEAAVPSSAERIPEPSQEGSGSMDKVKEFLMNYLDLILTALAALTAVVFIVLWILLFNRHRKLRKRRKEFTKRHVDHEETPDGL